jgi:pantoate--beta-alanine ligase
VVTDGGLEPLPDTVPAGTEARILVAARLGATRLIDNAPLLLGATLGSLRQ